MKKVWIYVLAVFMFVSAITFAGAAVDIDLKPISIENGNDVSLNIKVTDLQASEPVKFTVDVRDASGSPIDFALSSLITSIKGENFDEANSMILVGNYPVSNGFSFTSDGYPAFITISGEIKALDSSKPVSVDIGLNGIATTPIHVEGAKAVVEVENIKAVADGAKIAVSGSKIDDQNLVVKGGVIEIEVPEVQPTVVPTEVQPTATEAQPTATEGQPTTTETQPTTTETQPTETKPAGTPAPFLGILAGLAVAGIFLRRK